MNRQNHVMFDQWSERGPSSEWLHTVTEGLEGTTARHVNSSMVVNHFITNLITRTEMLYTTYAMSS